MGFRRWKNRVHHIRKGRGKCPNIKYIFVSLLLVANSFCTLLVGICLFEH
jgi:hypothetical protein